MSEQNWNSAFCTRYICSSKCVWPSFICSSSSFLNFSSVVGIGGVCVYPLNGSVDERNWLNLYLTKSGIEIKQYTSF